MRSHSALSRSISATFAFDQSRMFRMIVMHFLIIFFFFSLFCIKFSNKVEMDRTKGSTKQKSQKKEQVKRKSEQPVMQWTILKKVGFVNVVTLTTNQLFIKNEFLNCVQYTFFSAPIIAGTQFLYKL